MPEGIMLGSAQQVRGCPAVSSDIRGDLWTLLMLLIPSHADIHERAPYIKSMLLYGGDKTGKTLLSHVSVAVGGLT